MRQLHLLIRFRASQLVPRHLFAAKLIAGLEFCRRDENFPAEDILDLHSRCTPSAASIVLTIFGPH